MLAYIRWSARSLVPVFIRSQKVCVCSLRTEINCTGGSVIRHSHLHREHPRSTFLDTFRRFKFDGNPLQCWNCGGRDATKQLFCSKCKVLQRPEQSSTYFDIIGVAPTYNVSLSELTSRYRMLQSSLHPDRFSNRSEEEKIISEDYSALVNAAYSTLLHPMKRGLYMLQLRGVSLEEGDIQTSPLLLMEVMERNEELVEARDEASVKRIAADNKQRLDQLAREAVKAFQAEDISTAQQILIKMKYYNSLDEKIKDTKQKKGIMED
uniref:J domain-containing protein n=1 Tax=Timema tahoe TaxID=61484 RepID=A0A7R9IKK4_9NEOP|nr:unnamed protein product [Timema tahoe]